MKIYKLYLIGIAISFVVYIIGGFEAHSIPSGNSLEAPSFEHFLGTDDLGVDILAQLCYGGGHSLIIGGFSALIAVSLGFCIGAAAGYYGGRVDQILTGLCDIVTSVPQMILLILLGAFLGSSYITLVIVLALMSWDAYGQSHSCESHFY